MKRNRLNLKSMLATISLACMSALAMGQISGTQLPVIDGDGSDAIWATAPTFTIDTLISVANVTGPSDCSGSFKVLWSTDSLYLLVSMNDDSLDETHYGTNGNDQYLNDLVAIYIDAFNKKSAGYSNGDTTEAYYEVYFDETNLIKGRSGNNWANPGSINHANVITNHVGYVSEVAIAWSEFGLKPFAGSLVGFDVKLSDNDNDGTGRGLMSWYDKSDNGWQYPSVFGTIYLNRDGTVKGVYNTSSPVVVDGLGDDFAWTNAETWDITKYVTGGANTITSDNDFSGQAKFLWTADSLYAFYTVKDDINYFGAANNYANDNATIALDLFNKKTATYIDTTQFYWEIYWFDAPTDGRVGTVKPKVNPIDLVKVMDNGVGYTLEAGIGFNLGGFVPAEGDIIGIDVKLNDNDGAGRDQLAYQDNTDNIWQNPRVMGYAKLDANGKVRALPIPGTPVVAAEITGSDVTLTWPAVDNAAKYALYKGGVALDTITALTYSETGLEDGTYIYGVRAISADGIVSAVGSKSVTIATVSVQNIDGSSLTVYPVPTSGEVNILSNTENIQTIVVMDITGKVVAVFANLNKMNAQINIENLATGTYFLKVSTSKDAFVTRVAKN